MALAPCPSCLRHVHASEPRCPFCAVAFAVGAAPTFDTTTSRARFGSRAALVFGGLALSATAAAAGCNAPEVPTLPAPATPSAGSLVDAAPPVESPPAPPPSASASAEAPDAASLPRAVVAIYGAPPPPTKPKPKK